MWVEWAGFCNNDCGVKSSVFKHINQSLFWATSSHAVEYSLVVARNSQLQELDLSSLESISGGGVLIFNNPQLCFLGNVSMYLTNPSQQHQCIVLDRRDPQTCSEHNYEYNVICAVYAQFTPAHTCTFFSWSWSTCYKCIVLCQAVPKVWVGCIRSSM